MPEDGLGMAGAGPLLEVGEAHDDVTAVALQRGSFSLLRAVLVSTRLASMGVGRMTPGGRRST